MAGDCGTWQEPRSPLPLAGGFTCRATVSGEQMAQEPVNMQGTLSGENIKQLQGKGAVVGDSALPQAITASAP